MLFCCRAGERAEPGTTSARSCSSALTSALSFLARDHRRRSACSSTSLHVDTCTASTPTYRRLLRRSAASPTLTPTADRPELAMWRSSGGLLRVARIATSLSLLHLTPTQHTSTRSTLSSMSSIPQATIGGVQVGRIGYGLMALTWAAKQTADEQAFRAIKTAVDMGATFINCKLGALLDGP